MTQLCGTQTVVCTERIREGGGDAWNYSVDVSKYLVKTHCLGIVEISKIYMIQFMPVSIENTGDP